MPKALDNESEIHVLICRGNEVALSKLYLAIGEKIIGYLQKKYPSVYKKDKNLVIQAVNEALLGYYRKPSAFKPEKSSLSTFLSMAAIRDLINLLEKEKKYSQLLKNVSSDVELDEYFWNNEVVTHENPESQTIEYELLQSTTKLLSTYFTSKLDRELALLILQGEKRTESYAEILKISQLSKVEKEKVVKRHKDRLKKIFARYDIEKKIKQLYDR